MRLEKFDVVYDFFINKTNKKMCNVLNLSLSDKQKNDLIQKNYKVLDIEYVKRGEEYILKNKKLNSKEIKEWLFSTKAKRYSLIDDKEDLIYNKLKELKSKKDYYMLMGILFGYSDRAIKHFIELEELSSYEGTVVFKYDNTGFTYLCSKDDIDYEINYLKRMYDIKVTKDYFIDYGTS